MYQTTEKNKQKCFVSSQSVSGFLPVGLLLFGVFMVVIWILGAERDADYPRDAE